MFVFGDGVTDGPVTPVPVLTMSLVGSVAVSGSLVDTGNTLARLQRQELKQLE